MHRWKVYTSTHSLVAESQTSLSDCLERVYAETGAEGYGVNQEGEIFVRVHTENGFFIREVPTAEVYC